MLQDIDMKSKETFFVSVTDSSNKTLFEVILKWIEPGTTIVSDCRAGDNALEKEGFLHLTVNHK